MEYFLVLGAAAHAADNVKCEIKVTPSHNTIQCDIGTFDLVLAECSFDGGPFQTCKLSYTHQKYTHVSEIGDVEMDILHEKASPGDHVLNMRLITTSGTLNVTISYTVPYKKAPQLDPPAAQQGIAHAWTTMTAWSCPIT